MELQKTYNPKEVEEKIYKLWEESGYFNPDKLPKTKKGAYTIVVPPPNITGSLHMGHALNATIQDIIIRKKRMEGYKTLWLPGTDHAGIATQNVVEKELKKQGISRHDIGRKKFLEKIWEWKEKYGHIILEQFKTLGCSMDWSRTRFTMDPEYQEAVKAAFDHYYKKGWIYRAKRVVNWCPRCATSLSDLELEYKETDGKLWHIKYPIVKNRKSEIRDSKQNEDYIIVATTRPETMLGDTAVAVNPKDKRYKKLVGKKVVLPIQNREIPIIEDRAIDMEFGTGAVKVTPAHDMTDAEIGVRHNLESREVIDMKGRMTTEAGKICEGLRVSECRVKVIEELKSLGLLVKEESYRHNVAVCYRCGTAVEPLPSLQWFLKMKELANMAVEAVKSGKVKFHPKRWENIYLNRLENERDWNISRQLWWGHKIPIDGEEDVLDTWFSSALWPFATLGWPKKTKDLKEFYPTQALSTARDIISIWVAKMVFSGLEFMSKKPFSDIIIHATILTKDGKRMSKSLGTGIDPMDLAAKYGSDATRFGLIWQAMGGQDIHWSEEHVAAGRKFCNKIWNAGRFVMTKAASSRLPEKPAITSERNQAILNELELLSKSTTEYIEKFEFGQALHKLYDFFWHEFADKYIESSKKDESAETKETLLYVYTQTLKLLHPFMPFVTEEIWTVLRKNYGLKTDLLIIETWPE